MYKVWGGMQVNKIHMESQCDVMTRARGRAGLPGSNPTRQCQRRLTSRRSYALVESGGWVGAVRQWGHGRGRDQLWRRQELLSR